MNSTMLWYATRASGIAALILLTATMLLGLVATNRPRARNWPGFAQQEIHRRISILSIVFVGIHVITSLLDTFVHIGWASILVPFTSSYSRLWVGVGTVGLDLSWLCSFRVSCDRGSGRRPGVRCIGSHISAGRLPSLIPSAWEPTPPNPG
jgi:hypothetical protein